VVLLPPLFHSRHFPAGGNVPIPLRIRYVRRYDVVGAKNALDAKRRAIGQQKFAWTLFSRSDTRKACIAIAKELGLLQRAHALNVALGGIPSAGRQKAEFDDCFHQAQHEIQKRLAHLLAHLALVNLNLEWLHLWMVYFFTRWINRQAGLKVAKERWAIKGSKAKGRQQQRIDNDVIQRRVECYLATLFEESSQQQFAANRHKSRTLATADLKWCTERLGLPHVTSRYSKRSDLRRPSAQ
jgi:hypothetical protein